MTQHDEYEYGRDAEYGQGPAQPQGRRPDPQPQGRGHDQQPYGAPHDGTYVPEPLPGPMPPHADPSGAYGAPPAGDSWSGHAPAQDGSPYGAPAAGDSWGATPPGTHPWTPAPEYGAADPAGPYGSAGPAASYGGPGPAGTWEHAAANPFPYTAPGQQGEVPYYGAEPAGDWSQPHAQQPHAQQPHAQQPHAQQPHAQQPYAQPYPQPQPHSYADPQPHPGTGGEPDRTAVLPVVEALPQQTPGGGHRAGHGPAAAAATGAPRTGSPIIAPGIRPAALTAVLALLMAGGAAAGKPGLTVFLVALQAVTAAGWFRLNGMWPARQGIALAFLAGVTADIALLATDGDHGPAAIVGTLGVWLLLVLVLQLRHHGSADERMSSLTATSASTLLTVLAAGYLATATSDAGTDPVIVGAVAVAVATLVRALPLPGAAVSITLALLAAAGSGLATGHSTGSGVGDAALLALACGGCALIGLRVASYDFPSRFVHFTAGVALPLTAAAPVVYALGRALAG